MKNKTSEFEEVKLFSAYDNRYAFKGIPQTLPFSKDQLDDYKKFKKINERPVGVLVGVIESGKIYRASIEEFYAPIGVYQSKGDKSTLVNEYYSISIFTELNLTFSDIFRGGKIYFISMCNLLLTPVPSYVNQIFKDDEIVYNTPLITTPYEIIGPQYSKIVDIKSKLDSKREEEGEEMVKNVVYQIEDHKKLTPQQKIALSKTYRCQIAGTPIGGTHEHIGRLMGTTKVAAEWLKSLTDVFIENDKSMVTVTIEKNKKTITNVFIDLELLEKFLKTSVVEEVDIVTQYILDNYPDEPNKIKDLTLRKIVGELLESRGNNQSVAVNN